MFFSFIEKALRLTASRQQKSFLDLLFRMGRADYDEIPGLHETDGRRMRRRQQNALDSFGWNRRGKKAPDVPPGKDRLVNRFALRRCKRRLRGSTFIYHSICLPADQFAELSMLAAVGLAFATERNDGNAIGARAGGGET